MTRMKVGQGWRGREAGTGQPARKHYGRQRERVLQSRAGRLGDDERGAVMFYPAWAAAEIGFIESFKGRLRDECLNVERFSSLDDARRKRAKFREHYNHERPHSALAGRIPAAFAALHEQEASTSLGARTPRQHWDEGLTGLKPQLLL